MLENFKKLKPLSFLYAGKPFEEAIISKAEVVSEDSLTATYDLTASLRVTSTLRYIREFDACEVVNRFENIGSEPTELVSELWDCSLTLPLDHEVEYRHIATLGDPQASTRLYAPTGSDWSSYEFYSDPDRIGNNGFAGSIFAGQTRRFSSSGGRSSQGSAPFFNVHKNGKGYIYAVGWTGQWLSLIHI